MTLDAIVYLFQTYWIFLVLALLIGIATGWYGSEDPAPDRADRP